MIEKKVRNARPFSRDNKADVSSAAGSHFERIAAASGRSGSAKARGKPASVASQLSASDAYSSGLCVFLQTRNTFSEQESSIKIPNASQ
ncbi:MAG TPA: hypothetical protein PKH33_07810 [bacterium]|nr:hypothetical protein [bacterium]